MAKYLVLIYGDAQQWADMSAAEGEALGAAHRAFVTKAGAGVLSGHELEWGTTATTLRADATGRVTPTDGPFLETKEVLGGYYLLEAADLDQAISLCSLLREVHAGHSGVEIRPVKEHS